MGLLILGLLGYLVLRGVMPNATFYSLMTVDSKILVVLLLVASLVTGLASHTPVADRLQVRKRIYEGFNAFNCSR